jgi:hypothetical protein
LVITWRPVPTSALPPVESWVDGFPCTADGAWALEEAAPESLLLVFDPEHPARPSIASTSTAGTRIRLMSPR